MFSILKDVIAVPDISTLSTHHILGISRYTYGFKCVGLTGNTDYCTIEPLLIASGFAGLDGSLAVVFADDY